MSTDKLATLRAHSHRRAASNPFPIILMDRCSDSGSSGGESDVESNSILRLMSTADTSSTGHGGLGSTGTCTHDAESDEEMSIILNTDAVDPTESDNLTGNDATLKRYQTLDIPDLSHSPTLNRYSVSIFDFTSKISKDISPSSTNEFTSPKSPEMAAAALLNKIHRSFTNLTSVSSIESLDDYRGMVLKEIIDTERTYLNSLDTLLSILLPALEGLVAPRDLRLLFPCQLEPLLEIHQNLLMKLEERIEGMSQWHGIVGDIFGRLCSDKEKEFISVYSAYMNEFKVAMQTLVKYQNTSPLFCRTANNCIKESGQEGLNLSSFLLTPIQRLPRYELLLKQLMKHTSDDHPDTYYLQAAMESLHKDLTALDRSIQACQFASTVSSFKDDTRNKRSLKKNRKRHQSSRFAARIKRHFSQANIDDFTSSSSSSSSTKTSPGRRPVSALEKTSSFAVSEFNILEKMDSCDSRPSSSMGTSFPTTRAISCSEVHLLESKQPPHPPHLDRRVVVSFDSSSSRDEERDIDEFTERTPCLSHSSSITSHDSIAVVLNKRGSIYSNNSSNTSGFDSLTGVPVDFDERGESGYNGSTLRAVIPSAITSISSNDSGFSRDCYRGSNTGSGIIGIEGDKTPTIRTNYQNVEKSPSRASKSKRSNSTGGGGKKKTTISRSALKVIKMATGKEIGNTPLSRHQKNSSHSKSSNQLNRFSISDPIDFRHVQHGFSNRPLSIAL